MPAKAERSSTCGSCSGRPSPRLLPPATRASGSSRASAAAMPSASARSSSGRNAVTSSEPRQIGEGQLALMHVQPPELGAAMQLREHLARIEQALGVEGAFQALLLVEIGLVEHRAHEVALLDADAMLA